MTTRFHSFRARNKIWGMPQAEPPAPSREGFDPVRVTFLDGPLAGAFHSWALIERPRAVKLPARAPSCGREGCAGRPVFRVLAGGHEGCSLLTCDKARVRGYPCEDTPPDVKALACELHGGGLLVEIENNLGRMARLERI